MEKKFVKMSDLVGDQFTVDSVGKFVYKKWDNENRKMLISETWEQGYQKVYPVNTDKGTVDMNSGKMGEMLESVSRDGQSTIIGRTFNVKSNGKTGMEIRYFLNPERLDTTGEGYKKAVQAVNELKSKKQEEEDDGLDRPFTEEDFANIPF